MKTPAPVLFVDARRDAGLTQTDAAAELGVPRGTLYNYEAGRCLPDRNMLRQLSNLVGVPARRLVF